MFYVNFSHFPFFSNHTTESDYVKVYAHRKNEDPNSSGKGGGCYSKSLGRKLGGGKQVINLAFSRRCMRSGTIIHEFIHAWGFHHEHARPDRG